MKIKLSKSQWDYIGRKAGWVKKASWGNEIGDIHQPVREYSEYEKLCSTFTFLEPETQKKGWFDAKGQIEESCREWGWKLIDFYFGWDMGGPEDCGFFKWTAQKPNGETVTGEGENDDQLVYGKKL